MKTVLGIMSGTSLDGVDFALCQFSQAKDKWAFKILKTKKVGYSDHWVKKLKGAAALGALEFLELHNEYARFIGDQANKFIKICNPKPEIIACHGHTIFHQPKSKLTFQLGNGAEIASMTGITTVCDFRTLDVALGGQGAPLVPIGDQLLFPEYDFCVNLGGFANLSYRQTLDRYAFDICPVNIVLNHYAQKRGYEYDKNGTIGKEGKLNHQLLEKLDSIEYYSKPGPKSLGKEWVDSVFLPVVEKFDISDEDKVCTIYHHIVNQIGRATKSDEYQRVLFTGGGAHNRFLDTLLTNKLNHEVIMPDNLVIDFKEALIFALLGLLRMENATNCLATVTGASMDNCGGIVHFIK